MQSLFRSTRGSGWRVAVSMGGGGSGVTGIPEGPDVGAPMLRRSSELYALELSAMTFRAGEGEGEGMLPATLPSRLSSD